MSVGKLINRGFRTHGQFDRVFVEARPQFLNQIRPRSGVYGKQVFADTPPSSAPDERRAFLADFRDCPAAAFSVCLLMRTRRAFR